MAFLLVKFAKNISSNGQKIHRHHHELDLDLNDVAADTSKLVMLNAFYLKWLEDVITQRQKNRSIRQLTN